METSPFGAPHKVLGGVIEEPSISFRFEVWSSRSLQEHELKRAFQVWRQSLKEKTVLKNKTFRMTWTALD